MHDESVTSTTQVLTDQSERPADAGRRTSNADRHPVSPTARAESDDLHQFVVAQHAAHEHEKQSMARELHDELGQALTALKMDVDWLGARLQDSPAVMQSRLAAMLELIDDTITATRRIAGNLRPMILDDLGLGPAVESMVQAFARRSGIRCVLDIDPIAYYMGEPHATALFRITQELINNVAKHAKATRLRVAFSRSGNEITLQVSDDGAGFSANAMRKTTSFGIIGVRERAFLLGGTLELGSSDLGGASVTVRVPF